MFPLAQVKAFYCPFTIIRPNQSDLEQNTGCPTLLTHPYDHLKTPVGLPGLRETSDFSVPRVLEGSSSLGHSNNTTGRGQIILSGGGASEHEGRASLDPLRPIVRSFPSNYFTRAERHLPYVTLGPTRVPLLDYY